MRRTASVDLGLRTLAYRAMFERIIKSDEITAVEVTRNSA
jgi:hypothetical protein